jgi:hypothetical protein
MANSLVPLTGAIPQRFMGRKPSGMLQAAKAGIQPSFGVVGYKGRNWWLKWQGENLLLKDPQTGAPNQSLDVVIVGVSEAISKIYYSKPYVEGDDAAPDCASTRGITPDVGVPHKQSDVCATCRHAQWGSRITDAGKKAKVCQDSRRIAVVPLTDIINEAFGGPMLLRIPATSMQNLSKYSDFLATKGVDMPWVATRLSFDYSVAYPKLTFEALGYLDDGQLADSDETAHHPLIGQLFDTTDTDDIEPQATDEPRGLHVVGGTPEPAEPPGEAPPPPPEEEEEVEEEAPPPPPAAAKPVNPFQAATKAAGAAQAAPAAKPAARRAASTPAPTQAPPDLLTAIDELLVQPA